MISDLKKISDLKEQEQSSRRKADKARGALEEILKRLRTEHGCAILQEAQKLLERREQEHSQCEDELEDLLAKYEEKWPDR